jgi:hypothetical protein
LTRPEPGYRLTFSRNAVGFPEATLLRELLRLDPGRSDYEVRRISVPSGAELQPLPDALDFVEVRTRTLLDMLTVLSKGVEVPEEHVCRGLAAQTPGPDGTLFDWTLTTRGLFHVCVSKKRPPEPNLAIEYEGYWYSIPASDKRSQATLSLIQALFNLQLSEPKKSGPLLTLPVGL